MWNTDRDVCDSHTPRSAGSISAPGKCCQGDKTVIYQKKIYRYKKRDRTSVSVTSYSGRSYCQLLGVALLQPREIVGTQFVYLSRAPHGDTMPVWATCLPARWISFIPTILSSEFALGHDLGPFRYTVFVSCHADRGMVAGWLH